jgi:hypothetical protein
MRQGGRKEPRKEKHNAMAISRKIRITLGKSRTWTGLDSERINPKN